MNNINFRLGRMLVGLVKIIDSILVLTSFCLVHSNISLKFSHYMIGADSSSVPLLYLNPTFYHIFSEFFESLLQVLDGLIMITSFGFLELDLKQKFTMFMFF